MPGAHRAKGSGVRPANQLVICGPGGGDKMQSMVQRDFGAQPASPRDTLGRPRSARRPTPASSPSSEQLRKAVQGLPSKAGKHGMADVIGLRHLARKQGPSARNASVNLQETLQKAGDNQGSIDQHAPRSGTRSPPSQGEYKLPGSQPGSNSRATSPRGPLRGVAAALAASPAGDTASAQHKQAASPVPLAVAGVPAGEATDNKAWQEGGGWRPGRRLHAEQALRSNLAGASAAPFGVDSPGSGAAAAVDTNKDVWGQRRGKARIARHAVDGAAGRTTASCAQRLARVAAPQRNVSSIVLG